MHVDQEPTFAVWFERVLQPLFNWDSLFATCTLLDEMSLGTVSKSVIMQCRDFENLNTTISLFGDNKHKPYTYCLTSHTACQDWTWVVVMWYKCIFVKIGIDFFAENTHATINYKTSSFNRSRMSTYFLASATGSCCCCAGAVDLVVLVVPRAVRVDVAVLV